MSQPTLSQAVLAPVTADVAPGVPVTHRPRLRQPSVHQPSVRQPGVYHLRTPAEVALAARADVVRLSLSARVPGLATVARLVTAVERELAALGRPRHEVRIELEVEVVVVADDDPRRVRDRMACLDVMAGLPWNASATRVVARSADVQAQVDVLVGAVGADGAALVVLGEARVAPLG